MDELTREEVEQTIKRVRKSDEILDLSGANLSGADFSGANLSRAKLIETNFSGNNLIWADFSGANLSKANFSWANLSQANLSGADFSGANLSGANLNKANLSHANFSQAKLNKTNLSRVDFIGNNLSKANLSEANLINANLSRANLSGANLSGANLSGADLSGTDFSEADLSKANLSEANFRETILHKANFSHVIIKETSFIKIDLGQVKGLDTVNHIEPSAIIDINTIYQSKNRIPKVFLEQAGVHPDIIRWQHSLHTLPTVFVCYSPKDELEKEQLLTHLGVLRELSLVDIWDDTRIAGGTEWEQEITNAIARTSVAILLVSANFLTSQTIKELEIPELLKRRENDQNFVIYPIIAKPCAWNSFEWLSKIQVRPHGGEPIWVKGKDIDVDVELTKIATEVTDIIKSLWLSNR
ncbi:MAG: toll/interleukin-1 receptor domain-containing protein [Anaerolineae bacterium]|nr:toll/interleukin-1 receptor domain-containing protein [Anaerolineae bacterium]